MGPPRGRLCRWERWHLSINASRLRDCMWCMGRSGIPRSLFGVGGALEPLFQPSGGPWSPLRGAPRAGSLFSMFSCIFHDKTTGTATVGPCSCHCHCVTPKGGLLLWLSAVLIHLTHPCPPPPTLSASSSALGGVYPALAPHGSRVSAVRLSLTSPKRGTPWAPKALFGLGRQAQSPKPYQQVGAKVFRYLH